MKSEKSSDKVILLKVGKHLAELRKANGYTQRQLSEKIYVGEKTISKWERGLMAPDITMIKTLSDFYNVSADELLSGEKKEVYTSDTTIDAINVYSNQTKYKVLKKTLIIIMFIMVLFFIIFLVDRHYRWNIDEFEVDGEFHISGYMVSNSETSKIVISNINYKDPNAGLDDEELKTYWLKLSLFSNEEEICTTQNEYEYKIPLTIIFDNYNYVCESNKKLNLKDLSLHIDYYKDNELIKKRIILNSPK